jgi:hypothetical protein
LGRGRRGREREKEKARCEGLSDAGCADRGLMPRFRHRTRAVFPAVAAHFRPPDIDRVRDRVCRQRERGGSGRRGMRGARTRPAGIAPAAGSALIRRVASGLLALLVKLSQCAGFGNGTRWTRNGPFG